MLPEAYNTLLLPMFISRGNGQKHEASFTNRVVPKAFLYKVARTQPLYFLCIAFKAILKTFFTWCLLLLYVKYPFNKYYMCY